MPSFTHTILSRILPQEKYLHKIILAGFLIRVLPLLLWLDWPCVRDECTYLRLSERLLNGQGMTASNGWIWAPGYPFLVSIHEALTGYGAGIKTTQAFVSIGVMCLIYHLGCRFDSKKVGSWALIFYAFSPTHIFFAQSLWSECIYGGLLLLALYYFDRSTEESSVKNILKMGALVGVCVLFRGVATYMLPIFGFALLWQRWLQSTAYKQVILLFFTAALTVAPYSFYASSKFGSFMISDRTLGQMMWLGNNDFEPIAFDWGNGPLSGKAYKRHISEGREPCASRRDPVLRDKCQTKAGVEWIKDHPKEFLQRIPLRLAQLLNPHSFLTRHIRWGYWLGLPRFLDELIVFCNVFFNLAVLWLGSLGLIVYGRRARDILIGGIILYHGAAISLLAGLTRYRVPLEPLLILYMAMIVVHRKQLWKDIKKRKYAVCLGAVILLPLTLWFLPTGWVWWRHW